MFAIQSLQIHRFRAILYQPAVTTVLPSLNTSTSTTCLRSDGSTHQPNFTTEVSSNKPESAVHGSKIVAEIARNHGLSLLKSRRILNTILDTIVESVGDDQKVMLKNFGTFSSYVAKERKGRNFVTKETISIPSRRRIRFKPSETFRKSSD